MTIDITLLEIIGLVGMGLHVLGVFDGRSCNHDGPHLARRHGLGADSHPVSISFAAGVRALWPRQVSRLREGPPRRRFADRSHRAVLEKKEHLFRVREHEADPKYFALEELAETPFTCHNDARLLVDGNEAFPAMFAGIESAKDYIIVQFYIIRDDTIGRQLKELLERKSREGVRVYVLYDEVGSYYLPRAYCNELTAAGVVVRAFRTSKGFRNRLQINFRNHRKIVLVDGERAYVGGMNIGDEYLGRSPVFGPWRDTNLEVRGPLVEAIQFAFLEDWFWATGEVPELDWTPHPAPEKNMTGLCLASDPSDLLETCGLFFLHAISTAQKRLWIATPYFVPDGTLTHALQLAALRGVDVRIMLPQKPDHKLVYLAAFSYIADTEIAGVKFYRYQPGFMHHKVLLVDDDLAAVGTANFDNRSIRLNFEMMLIFADRSFASSVSQMLERDFANCRQATAADIAARPFYFHFAVRLARLMSPVL